jgi:hypothetical protein
MIRGQNALRVITPVHLKSISGLESLFSHRVSAVQHGLIALSDGAVGADKVHTFAVLYRFTFFRKVRASKGKHICKNCHKPDEPRWRQWLNRTK